DADADPNARANDGSTPLHKAAEGVNLSLIRLLLAHKADLDPKDVKGRTPLHLAMYSAYEETAALLIARGADPGARDNDRRTPSDLRFIYDIHYAAGGG